MRTVAWALAVVALLAGPAVGASPAPVPEGAVLRVDPERIHLQPLHADDLGAEARAPGRWSRVTVEVAPPGPGGGWILTVKAGTSGATRNAAAAPRVRWKLASDPVAALRPLDESAREVLRGSSPGLVAIDLVFDVDWSTAPGRYDVDLVFDVAAS